MARVTGPITWIGAETIYRSVAVPIVAVTAARGVVTATGAAAARAAMAGAAGGAAAGLTFELVCILFFISVRFPPQQLMMFSFRW